MRRVTEIQESALIVAADMSLRKKWQRAVLNFVLIAGRTCKILQDVARLRVDAGPVVLISATWIREIAEVGGRHRVRIRLRAEREWIGRKETLYRICTELAIVGFRAH